MVIKRNCKVCGKEFDAIKSTQLFDCRRCFKRDYYTRNREKIIEERLHPKYPQKVCSYCGEWMEIPYDPTKNPDLYEDWACKRCGVSNQLLWRFNDELYSHQNISSFLASMTVSQTYSTSEVTVISS